MTRGCPKHGNVSCDYRSARFWTRGTRPGCAGPAATISSSATYLSRRSTPSASRTRSWSNGPGRFTRSRSCSSLKDPARLSESPATRSTRWSRPPPESRRGVTPSVSASRHPKCFATTFTFRTRSGGQRLCLLRRALMSSTSSVICGRACSTADNQPIGNSRYSPLYIRTPLEFA